MGEVQKKHIMDELAKGEGVDVYKLQKFLADKPQSPMATRHHFADGQYLREAYLPKGTLLVGKKHRYRTMNIIIKGKASVYDQDTGEVMIYEAPAIYTSEAGRKKIVYAHEDTLWCNAQPTTETDPEKIEKIFIIDEDIDIILEEEK